MNTQRKHWKVDGPSHLKKAFIEDLKSLGHTPKGPKTDEMITEGCYPIYQLSDNQYKAKREYSKEYKRFELPQDYTIALEYIKGNIAEADHCEQEKKKQFKNSDWSVEGSYGLIKAFSEDLDRQGFKYWNYNPAETFKKDFDRNKYLVPSDDNSGDYLLVKYPKSNHFKLPDQWDEALKYATETVEEDDSEEIQEGDWIWVRPIRSGCDFQDGLIKYSEKNKWTYGFDLRGKWCIDINIKTFREQDLIKRKASKSEVEDRLWKEWEKRCKEADVKENPGYARLAKFPSRSFEPANHGENPPKSYHFTNDCLWNSNGLIYKQGNWAIPKPSLPEIEISGYKAEYRKDSVKFGCVSVEADTIKELDRIQRESGKEIFIRVGEDGSIYPEELRQIAEHFSRK